eukprot:scaffold23614_cov129-Isochrysis_galbana.AAC.2
MTTGLVALPYQFERGIQISVRPQRRAALQRQRELRPDRPRDGHRSGTAQDGALRRVEDGRHSPSQGIASIVHHCILSRRRPWHTGRGFGARLFASPASGLGLHWACHAGSPPTANMRADVSVPN